MSIDIRMTTHRVVDRLRYRVYTDRATMGAAAASYIEGLIVATLARQPCVRMIFSAAPSQDEVLASLAVSDLIEWSRVHAFHMDEYIGLSADAPQGFGQFLRTRLFEKVSLASVNYLDISTVEPQKECERYARLLTEAPIDICCLGVGENGHIAFNDPPVADFDDPKTVKIVSLDEVCRQQQVNDGCFASLSDVPTQAMTLTIPSLVAAKHLVCVVPAATKRNAVHRLLTEDISTKIPASIMRKHPSAVLFLEANSYI